MTSKETGRKLHWAALWFSSKTKKDPKKMLHQLATCEHNFGRIHFVANNVKFVLDLHNGHKETFLIGIN